MALKREAILEALQASMLGIQAISGFSQSVKTVYLGYEIPRNFNLSGMSLIFIEPGDDRYAAPETHGGGTNDSIKRDWPISLTGMLAPASADADVRMMGEAFLSDIVKQLLTTRPTSLKTAGVDWLGIERILGPDNFERSENRIASVGVDIRIAYRFTPATI